MQQQTTLLAAATRWGALNGEPSPVGVGLFGITRQAFNDLLVGSDVGDDRDVYVVVLHGRFVGFQAHHPPNSRMPRGLVMYIAYDAATNEVTDWALGDVDIDYGKIAPSNIYIDPCPPVAHC